MAEQRVSLTKKQIETAAGAELLKLCAAIKSDGQLSKEDIIHLAHWLGANKDCGLPAVDYLHGVVERIVADKRVTTDEMKELHAAVEKVMPGDARKAVVESRKAIEKTAKQKKKEIERQEREAEKQAERMRKEQEREQRRQERASRPQGFHSKVAGVSQRNDSGLSRQTIIRECVKPGMTLVHKREPDNDYDENAISLWVQLSHFFNILKSDVQVGYLNENVACDLAPYLDSGGWARITVTAVTGGGDKYYGVNIFIEDGREVR